MLKKYGPWALVAGGAQGIGEAYSRYAASRGLNVIAFDVDQSALDEIAEKLPKEFGIQCLPVCVDLSAADAAVTGAMYKVDGGMRVWSSIAMS